MYWYNINDDIFTRCTITTDETGKIEQISLCTPQGDNEYTYEQLYSFHNEYVEKYSKVFGEPTRTIEGQKSTQWEINDLRLSISVSPKEFITRTLFLTVSKINK